jgi:hypothetical protein
LDTTVTDSRRIPTRWLALAAAVAGALAAGALALWAAYGGAVFHGMIAAGIAWCF